VAGEGDQTARDHGIGENRKNEHEAVKRIAPVSNENRHGEQQTLGDCSGDDRSFHKPIASLHAIENALSNAVEILCRHCHVLHQPQRRCGEKSAHPIIAASTIEKIIRKRRTPGVIDVDPVIVLLVESLISYSL
jgi:hypothetical protein